MTACAAGAARDDERTMPTMNATGAIHLPQFVEPIPNENACRDVRLSDSRTAAPCARYDASRLCKITMLPWVSFIIARNHAAVSCSVRTGMPRSLTAATAAVRSSMANKMPLPVLTCRVQRKYQWACWHGPWTLAIQTAPKSRCTRPQTGRSSRVLATAR